MWNWTTLRDLRPGAVFVTEDGIMAMKTEYHTFNNCTQFNCYLVSSGESAHFKDGDLTLVEEIPVHATVALLASCRSASGIHEALRMVLSATKVDANLIYPGLVGSEERLREAIDLAEMKP